MKKSRGFTLIELLIVTVVIATLMAIVFRLAGTGGESTARAKTLARLQKLSNALSGYYAAFGSYPPVPLQGRSRDIYREVDGSLSLGYGIQSGDEKDRNEATLADSGKRDEKNEIEKQIEAACRAQPVAAGFPYTPGGDEEEVIQALCSEYNMNYKVLSSYSQMHNLYSSEFYKNPIFMFGLMSFLLPRYQFMLDGEHKMYTTPGGPWMANNRLPYTLDGTRPQSWADVQKALGRGKGNSSNNDAKERFKIESLPSQAVCARWMPNFKNLVTSRPVRTVTEFFGVDTEAPHDYGDGEKKWFIYGQRGYDSPAGFIGGTKTVLDGWGEDFYYYSPPPYQSYQLWSSGPNKRTFPPWMEPEEKDRKVVNRWIADDIKVGDK